MGCTLGRYGTVEVSSDGGTIWTKVEKIIDATLSIDSEKVECTSHDSNGVRERHPSFKNVTLDFNCRYDDGAPGQDAIYQAICASTGLLYRWRNETGLGKRQIVGRTSSPDNVTFTAPNEDLADFSTTATLDSFVPSIQ